MGSAALTMTLNYKGLIKIEPSTLQAGHTQPRAIFHCIGDPGYLFCCSTILWVLLLSTWVKMIHHHHFCISGTGKRGKKREREREGHLFYLTAHINPNLTIWPYLAARSREGNGTPLQEQPGRLRSVGSLKVRHNWATSLSLFAFMHWRRKWQPTPVFMPWES